MFGALTKKFPLNMTNRAIYLFKLRAYNIFMNHKYSESIRDKIDQYKTDFDQLFDIYFNFMCEKHPISCVNDLIEFFKYPKICEKYVNKHCFY